MSIFAALGHSLRLARAGFVFAREGAFVGVDPALLPPVGRPPLALANLIAKRNVEGLSGLSRAIDRLGPSYVKLGQFLSTRPDIVGTQGRARTREPAGPGHADEPGGGRRHYRGWRSAGRSNPCLQSFGEPVAAASIAQVHRADVEDGRRRKGRSR